MRLHDYTEPFEDEELERRARDHYEQAREQGSILPDAVLMEQSRRLAHEEHVRQIGTDNEAVPIDEEEV
ncbi:MAG: hypothetical protein C4340_03650 [Armatimonadota bacterium]